MAYAEVGTGTGTYIRTTTGAYTVTGTLSVAPSAAGHWVAVAVYNSRMYLSTAGGLPLSSVKCGTVDLVRVESSTNNCRPELWMAPYQAGMTTSVVMSGNAATTTATGTYGYAMLVFSGASTAITASGSWNAFRQTNGLGMFDGGGTNTFGAVNTAGTTSAASVSWTNSNNAIANNYAISNGQGEPWIATAVQTLSFNAGQYKTTTFGSVVATYSGLNVLGQSIYYLGTSGWFNNNQIVVNSTTGIYAGGQVPAQACAPSGNYQFYYNGVSTFAGQVYLNNCFLAISPIDTTPIANFTLPTGTTIGCCISAQNTIPVLVHNNDPIFSTGLTVQGNATTASRVTVTTTGNTSVLLTLMAGYTTITGTNISAKIVSIGGSNSPTVGGAIYTMVNGSRILSTRPNSTTNSFSGSSLRLKAWNRAASTLQSSRTSIVRSIRRVRAVVTQLSFASSTVKSITRSVSIRSALTELIVLNRVRVQNRALRVLYGETSSLSYTRLLARAVSSLSIFSSNISRVNIFSRALESGFSQLSRVSPSRVFRRSVETNQVVSATVVRNRTYGRGVQVQSSYVIGNSRSVTFVRRVMANSSSAIEISRKLGKNYLVVSTATIRQATSGSVRLLIPVNVLWNSAKNTATNLLIRAQSLVNENIFVNSDDWVESSNGQPTEGNETEIFDDVPETVNEVDDQLGVDIVPFHE